MRVCGHGYNKKENAGSTCATDAEENKGEDYCVLTMDMNTHFVVIPCVCFVLQFPSSTVQTLCVTEEVRH